MGIKFKQAIPQGQKKPTKQTTTKKPTKKPPLTKNLYMQTAVISITLFKQNQQNPEAFEKYIIPVLLPSC